MLNMQNINFLLNQKLLDFILELKILLIIFFKIEFFYHLIKLVNILFLTHLKTFTQ